MCHSLGSLVGPGTKQNYLLLSWFCGVQDDKTSFTGKKKENKEKKNAFRAVCLRCIFKWWMREDVFAWRAQQSIQEDGTNEMVTAPCSMESHVSAFVQDVRIQIQKLRMQYQYQ